MTSRLPFISRGSLLGVAAAIGLSGLATATIHANVEESIAKDRIPLPVAVTRYITEDSYQRTANYIGIVRAGSDSALGFEVAGTIDTMVAREGLRVNAGDLLAALDLDRRTAQLRAAQADLARIRAELELAQLQSDRLAELEAKGLASQQNYDEARLNVQALAAAEAATAARLHSAELEIEKSQLLAPFDGVVAERLVQRGTVVNAGSPVIRLVANSGFEAHVGVPMRLAAGLQVGNSYRLKTSTADFQGVLRAVRTDVDPTTLTVGAVFDLDADSTLSVGENIVLEYQETIDAQGAWLPLSALIEGDRGLWSVLVVAQQDGHAVAVREAVEVLYSRGDRVFVRGTVADNAQVVATGLQRLSPGSPIDPVEDAASASSGDH